MPNYQIKNNLGLRHENNIQTHSLIILMTKSYALGLAVHQSTTGAISASCSLISEQGSEEQFMYQR
jgi:hypothetical protein